MIPTLKAKIKEESEIHTDGWRAYFNCKKHFANWASVNHSKYFVDPDTKVNTNRCEGIWKHLKKTILHGTKREKIEEYVQLHNFKEMCKSHAQFKDLDMFLNVFGVFYIFS